MRRFILGLMFAMTGGVCCVLGAETAVSGPSTQPASAVPVNKKCPVTGEAVDPKVTIDYKQKVIGFCCQDCVDEFRKSPEKYTKKLN